MTCGVAALLRPGGPVRVPLRDCCVAALLGADGVTTTSTCLAAPRIPPGPVPPVTATVGGRGQDAVVAGCGVAAEAVSVAGPGEDPW